MSTSRSEHSEEIQRLMHAVKVLWSAFGRKADAETCAVWAQSLRPYMGPTLWRVFREAAEGDNQPKLGEVLGKLRAILKAEKGSDLHILSTEEREKSDKAAVLSMLWLHHVKGWPTSAFEGTIFEERFKKIGPEALAEAAKHYPRALIEGWMDDQKRAGN